MTSGKIVEGWVCSAVYNSSGHHMTEEELLLPLQGECESHFVNEGSTRSCEPGSVESTEILCMLRCSVKSVFLVRFLKLYGNLECLLLAPFEAEFKCSPSLLE